MTSTHTTLTADELREARAGGLALGAIMVEGTNLKVSNLLGRETVWQQDRPVAEHERHACRLAATACRMHPHPYTKTAALMFDAVVEDRLNTTAARAWVKVAVAALGRTTIAASGATKIASLAAILKGALAGVDPKLMASIVYGTAVTGGGMLGAGLWKLKRDATEGDAEEQALRERVAFYRNLADEVKQDRAVKRMDPRLQELAQQTRAVADRESERLSVEEPASAQGSNEMGLVKAFA